MADVGGGRVDTLRWSFVQEATDFTANAASIPGAPGGQLVGGGFDSLDVKRIHRPRAEPWVSSFGPGVFSNLDAKLTLRPQGGSQNAILIFEPQSDGSPTTA